MTSFREEAALPYGAAESDNAGFGKRGREPVAEQGLTSLLVVEFSGGPAVRCGVVEVVIGPVG